MRIRWNRVLAVLAWALAGVLAVACPIENPSMLWTFAIVWLCSIAGTLLAKDRGLSRG